MFKPAKIVRVRIFVTKRNYALLMDILNDTAAIHIEPVGEYDKESLKGVENEDIYKDLNLELQRTRSIESNMIPKETSKRVVFKDDRALLAASRKLVIEKRLAGIIRERDSARAQRKVLNDRMKILRKLEGFKEDMSILSNDSVSSFILETPGRSRKNPLDIAEVLSGYAVYKINNNTIASVKKSQREEFASICKEKGINVENIPPLSGKVAELQKESEKEAKKVDVTERSIAKSIDDISDRYYNTASAIREQLEIETEKLNVAAKFGSTESVILVEGWIEESNIPKIREIFSKVTDDEFVLERLEIKELPPTKLQNPSKFKLFESFIRFYSLPKSNEIDPTILFGVVFPVFFGFMVGDAGYGLFMFVAFFWVAHRIIHPPKRSRIPRKLARFVHTILSNRGLLILSKSIMIGSIVAIAFGLIFGEFFGFKLPYTPLFRVDTGVATLLLISGWIGVVMVEFGYVLGSINKLYIGDRKGAFGRIGWGITAMGIVLIGLNILQKGSISDLNALVGYILLTGGVVTVIRSEGLSSLMEIPSVISHMLSYMRLIGILLASVILAEVIDKIFLADTRASFAFVVVGGTILIFGQLFNIIIAIFEAGIQGARLIYVEFFSKFFSGNGKVFKPFGVERKRTAYKFRLDD